MVRCVTQRDLSLFSHGLVPHTDFELRTATPYYRHWLFLIALATLTRFIAYWTASHFYGGPFSAMCHWDCHWYLSTITDGYSREPQALSPNYDKTNWAFFPAYIVIARFFILSGLFDAWQAATLISVLSTFGFLSYGFAYIRETRDTSTAWLFVWISLSLPNSIYYSFAYTESLFLFLSAGAMYYYNRGNPYKSSAFSAILTGSRAVGICFVPVIAIQQMTGAWLRWRRDGGGFARFIALLPDAALPIAIAPLGLFAFMQFLHAHMGDALAFKHVQAAWGRSVSMPFVVALQALQHNDLRALPDQSSTLNALVGLLAIIAGIGLAIRRRFAESWLCITAILIPMATGLESLPRFAVGTIAFLFGVTDWLAGVRSIWLRKSIILVCLAFQALLLRYWFIGAQFLI
jgi:hypothetical protein